MDKQLFITEGQALIQTVDGIYKVPKDHWKTLIKDEITANRAQDILARHNIYIDNIANDSTLPCTHCTQSYKFAYAALSSNAMTDDFSTAAYLMSCAQGIPVSKIVLADKEFGFFGSKKMKVLAAEKFCALEAAVYQAAIETKMLTDHRLDVPPQRFEDYDFITKKAAESFNKEYSAFNSTLN